MVNNGADPPILWWVAIVVLFSGIIGQSVLQFRRELKFTAFAEKLGMAVWPDGSLPRDLPLQTASFQPVRKVVNVARGSMAAVPVACFDVEKSANRSVYYFTVVAAKGPGYPFGSERFDPELATERLGEWFLLYRPRKLFSFRTRLMPFEEIEAQLRSVRPQQVRAGSSAPAG